jgi:hypothetical protein
MLKSRKILLEDLLVCLLCEFILTFLGYSIGLSAHLLADQCNAVAFGVVSDTGYFFLLVN